MHKFSKNIALVGAALTVAMAPAIAGAQSQTAPHGEHAGHQGTKPSSMPQTGPVTTPPAAPSTTPPTNPEAGDPDDMMGDQTTDVTNGQPAPVEAPAANDAAPGDAATTASTTAARAPAATPEQRQAAMKTWPSETLAFYEGLTAERQEMFWALTDTDKVRLSKLPDAQKELAWTQIEAQIETTAS